MFHSAAKAAFGLLAQSTTLQKLASRYGMRSSDGFARRFIAGETVEEAIDAARSVEERHFLHTLDYLGENVATLAEAEAAGRDYVRVIAAIVQAGIGRNLSLKLTQLGLDVDRASAVDNFRRIVDRAQGFFIRIDMESSSYTDVTLDIFETLWNQGYRDIGVVLQADLFRTEKDIHRIIGLGARIRLVKGAYKEPASIAYQKKEEVDEAYARLMTVLFRQGHYPAFATHDEEMIARARRYAVEHAIGSDQFEFQMLYGIRRDLQTALLDAGYRVRIYIPFGRQWFPYFMRRLGERPANVGFVVRGVLHER